MSYRDAQTDIALGTRILGTVEAIPGLGQFATLVEDVIGAFGLASEQDAYNRMIWNYYATPVQQGGGFNPGTKASRALQRSRQRMFLWTRSR
jgi:phosphoribosylformimino-5-aminoimidazole carboxamide ribonucleotide (ProFAR) isomerase